MEVVHTCHDVRYWSEILCCTIPTHLSDLEVKKFILKFLVKVFRAKLDSGKLCCPVTVLILLFVMLAFLFLYIKMTKRS